MVRWGDGAIHVQAMAVNGNYGKAAPAWNPLRGNTAGLNSNMVIQHLIQNDVYRTFVGLHNTSSTVTFTVELTIVNAVNTTVGSVFYKTLAPRAYLSFKPFKEAGVPTQICANCRLFIQPTAGGSGADGVMCYGSIANNYTNDTYALIAQMY